MAKTKSYLWILAICLLMTSFITIITQSNDKAKGQAKVVWEYKIITINAPTMPERALNQLGLEGWELVQVIHTSINDVGHGEYILKRAK